MADVIFKGFFEAFAAGLLETTPDVRLHLLMSGNSCVADELAVHVSDITTLDEFDGVGYAPIDAASVSTSYVDGSLQWRLVCAETASFGNPVAPGSDIIQGMLIKLYVDGVADNDYVLAYTETGGFGVNGANGAITLAVPAAGLLYGEAA